jgi:hypothetical protein
MADAQTTNYGWSYPSNGGDSGTWGATINATLIEIDAQVATNYKNSVRSGGGQFQASLGTHAVSVGLDGGGQGVRVDVDGSDFGYLLRCQLSAGKPGGGLVTVSSSGPSGTPNDGDMWYQYS